MTGRYYVLTVQVARAHEILTREANDARAPQKHASVTRLADQLLTPLAQGAVLYPSGKHWVMTDSHGRKYGGTGVFARAVRRLARLGLLASNDGRQLYLG